MHGDRQLFTLATAKIVARQNLREGVARAEPDHILEAHGAEPFTVEADLRFVRIENPENLLFISQCILADLLPGERRPRYIPTGGIADQASHVADHEDDGVAQILEVLHLTE